MTGADDLARRLVARHGGDNPGPGAFETLHQIIAALRQLPNAITIARAVLIAWLAGIAVYAAAPAGAAASASVSSSTVAAPAAPDSSAHCAIASKPATSKEEPFDTALPPA